MSRPIIGYVNHAEDATTILMGDGTSLDIENLRTQQTDIPAVITLTDIGGGAGRASFYIAWGGPVEVNSFALHKLGGSLPLDATFQVLRYNSLTQTPGTLIDVSATVPVWKPYTAESIIDDPDAVNFAMVSITQVLDGYDKVARDDTVRSISIVVESATGAGSTLSIGYLAAVETVNLPKTTISDGTNAAPRLELNEGRISRSANGGVASVSRLAIENPAFGFGSMSAQDKNTFEMMAAKVGTTWPIYVELRPNSAPYRDKESRGGIIRLVTAPDIRPVGAHGGTSDDQYTLSKQTFAQWR